MRLRKRFGESQLGAFKAGTNARYAWDYINSRWKSPAYSYWYYTPSTLYPYRSYETCQDEVHSGPPYKDGRLDLRRLNTSSYIRMPPVTVTGIVSASKIVSSGNPVLTYGGVKVRDADTEMTNFGNRTDTNSGGLTSHGHVAYSKFSPLKPKVDVGQTIAEIGELPRMLRSSAKFFSKKWRSMGGAKTWFGPKHVANEWLNTQFGWVPFVSTVADVIKTSVYLRDYIRRLRKYNGIWEKRGGRVAKIVNEETEAIYPTISYVSDSRFGQTTQAMKIRQTIFDAWYTAQYKYWIPELNTGDFSNPASVVAQLYGARISPTLVYDLVPWSWLLNWVSDVRSVINAADEKQFGQLVSRGGNIMGTTHERTIIDATFRIFTTKACSNWSYCESNASIYRDSVRKQRFLSSPYGFDVHSSDLSPWKVSILAALGVSRTF